MLRFGKQERRIRRIMVVEDEPLVAFDNEHMLGGAGYEVVATVDCLADAERVIEREELDLILTDVALSGDGDGLDVARAAQAKGVAVLFVTGRAMEHGGSALGCLVKPYNDRDLHAALVAVDRLLQGRKVKKLPAGLTLFRRDADAKSESMSSPAHPE